MKAEALLVLVAMPGGLRATLGETQVARLYRSHPRVRVELLESPARVASLLPDADAALIWPSFAPLLTPALRAGTRLRWVHSMPAGVDEVLTPELAAAEHVMLTASKGPMGPLMAEHAVLLMLALARNLPGFVRDQAERRWRFLADERPMKQLFGKTIAILGVGDVGGRVARICKDGFGMRVLGFTRTRRDHPHVDHYVERADLHGALAEADIVALCLALTPDTQRIIDAATLASMQPSAYLVNVARGGLIDEPALVAALQSGRLAGAGLDATAVEPLPSDSPLWTMPNVIITPHVAPARDRFGEHVVDFWCENIRRFAEGEPLLGPVDRQAGY